MFALAPGETDAFEADGPGVTPELTALRRVFGRVRRAAAWGRGADRDGFDRSERLR